MNASTWRCVLCGTWYESHTATCVGCLDAGTVVRVGFRDTAEIDALPEITDAAALARAAWAPVAATHYAGLRIGVGALIVVFGPPGGGKSTFATRLLDGIQGPVVYQSVEEAPGPSLHDRLQRCHVRRRDFTILGRATVDQLSDIVRQRRARALAVDSVQLAAFTPEELRHVLLVLPSVDCIVAVAQVNKGGRIEGRERLLHEADIAIACEAMHWEITKSRYQPVGASGVILDERRTSDAST